MVLAAKGSAERKSGSMTMLFTTKMLSIWYTSPLAPACQVRRSHVPLPCIAATQVIFIRQGKEKQKKRTRAAPLPGRSLKLMRHVVNALAVMFVLMLERRMLGEVVPSADEVIVIVRSGWSPFKCTTNQ